MDFSVSSVASCSNNLAEDFSLAGPFTLGASHGEPGGAPQCVMRWKRPMSHDRQLLDTIKTGFARKSSAQLQEITQARNQERWSAEAIAAAGEVLQDRIAGRAQEPRVVEEEPPPPPSPPDPYSLAFLALGAFDGLSGFTIMPVFGVDYAGGADPDLPVPFGPKMAWLAVDTTNTEGVAAALGLARVRAATWAEGIAAAQQSSVFVTPPLADWSLAVGAALFPPDRAEAFVKPLLERLSRQFGDAQYFCTQRDVELHVWARARQGRLVRGYGWLGEKGLILWDEGTETKEERDLGFRFLNREPPDVAQGDERVRKGRCFPDERCVMQLAFLWSIDPTTLDQEFKEPVMGLLGGLPTAVL